MARKSTSGGSIRIGEHCVKTCQAVIAKSPAESDLYGVIRGACEALGIKTLCQDMGSDVGIRLELDATTRLPPRALLTGRASPRSGTLTLTACGSRSGTPRRLSH